MQKTKVLIIAYYWPPAGGPGVQRWLKFVKYLDSYNITPVVYVPEGANYPLVDESLQKEIPNVTVLKQPIKEPYKLASLFSKRSKTISKGLITEQKKQSLIEKVLLFIRGNFFIPDARKAWVKPSISYLKNYLNENPVDVVITSGPPHSLHLIGKGLKRQLGVKWLADFRDPWTTIGYHKQLKLLPFAKRKHIKLEQSVLNESDALLVTSYNTQKEFQSKTQTPVTVITNGYDNEFDANVVLDSKFTLSHIGSLLSERNPEVLWRAIKNLINNNPDFKSLFKLQLVGAVGEGVKQSLQAYGLSDYVEYVGYVSHEAAIIYQKKSQVLLLIEINHEDTQAIIPGKLFEYMAAKRPIIAVGPKNSDVETIIEKTNTGQYFDYSASKEIETYIETVFNTFKQGDLTVNSKAIEVYSRKALTGQLAALINQVKG